jgi:hypothetical protein
MKTMQYVLGIALCATAGCGRPYVYTNSDVCIGNLRDLETAKLRWEIEEHKSTNDTPVMADLTRFMRKTPSCPNAGTYSLTRLGNMAHEPKAFHASFSVRCCASLMTADGTHFGNGRSRLT